MAFDVQISLCMFDIIQGFFHALLLISLAFTLLFLYYNLSENIEGTVLSPLSKQETRNPFVFGDEPKIRKYQASHGDQRSESCSWLNELIYFFFFDRITNGPASSLHGKLVDRLETKLELMSREKKFLVPFYLLYFIFLNLRANFP